MSAQPASTGDPKLAAPADLPTHIGVIMDGNGRWATRSGLPRSVGHERGVDALRKTVTAGQKLGLSYLTVYSFSTENWRRPASEVGALFSLLRAFIKKDLKRLKSEDVRISVFGTRSGLPQDICDLLDYAVSETSENTRFNLGIAFNYGGREEIARAARRVARKVMEGELSLEELDQDAISAHLDTSEFPDPDVIIRTGQEHRLSNFLVWQSAYSELVFMDVLWPDFGEPHLKAALETFSARERRFGGLSSGAA
ncbi:MAG: di-trans,poly-cis-decaprenylcistransferase [Henriciella sp.]|uniref:polyprenyl diphosphate synthase n=1 Tax=Henriciella sp. TaxID=1968823 RepID=UPI000C10CEC4|nr:polyprenyl diphosphate synthase [Henriciella sp.]MAN75318.1 di-trans,poly-cis-decaprenylcistransferase [Henriciella sp.]MBF33423.1 di-trans,poly-cis-decaprenylcistransferase [Hyphomonadaceae bacterium]PHR79842.1 MAG: di-trans,poly-cis-decaprenylcistransferase [Henriciella sp.]